MGMKNCLPVPISETKKKISSIALKTEELTKIVTELEIYDELSAAEFLIFLINFSVLFFHEKMSYFSVFTVTYT